jgi:hypothetical protein
MTTPVLSPISAAFAAIRYFTGADPYHYTIDNRPLTDLSTNDSSLANAADAGRRSGLLVALQDAVRFEARLGTTNYIEGFLASNPGANTIRIGKGALFTAGSITTSDARSVVKVGVLPQNQDFTINTVSLTGGQSVVYVIEMKYVDFSATTSSTFPLYDNANTALPSACLFGECQLQIVAGAANTTGSEVAPSVTAGWIQLYYVTVNGASPTTYSKVQYATTATFNSWGLPATSLPLTNLAAGGSTTANVDDVPTTQFADAATQTVGGFVTINPGGILVPQFNPYKPVKLKLRFSASVSANNFRVQASYKHLKATDAINAVSYTALTAETIAAGTADQLQALTLTNTIPALGTLDVTNTFETLRIRFARIGADGADTNTGVLRAFSIEAFQ